MQMPKMLSAKRGQAFTQLGNIMVGVAGLVIITVVVFLIIASVKANPQVIADSSTLNAVTQMGVALQTIPNFTSIIIIAAIGAVLLGLVGLFVRQR